MTFTVSVASSKGGVGKSTTVINLACALRDLGYRVRCADLDQRSHTLSGYQRRLRGVRVEPVPFAVESLAAADGCDVLLLDWPPGITPEIAPAFRYTDLVLVPVQCQYEAFVGLESLLALLEQARTAYDVPLPVRALLTLYVRQWAVSVRHKREAQRDYADILCQAVIPLSEQIVEAASTQRSVIDQAPGSRGALAYNKLAGEISQWLPPQKSAPPRKRGAL